MFPPENAPPSKLPPDGAVVIRNNVMRQEIQSSGCQGIKLANCGNAVIEQNQINMQTNDNAIRHDATCPVVKTFNNQKTGGVFLPAYNTSTAVHDPDLVTDAQDTLLGL